MAVWSKAGLDTAHSDERVMTLLLPSLCFTESLKSAFTFTTELQEFYEFIRDSDLHLTIFVKILLFTEIPNFCLTLCINI